VLQHSRSLPDREPDTRPVLDGGGEQLARLVEVIAGIEQAIDFRFVLGPFLDLIEVALIGDDRIAGFFVGPIGDGLRPISSASCFTAGAAGFRLGSVPQSAATRR
jgi:hypothetical protein